MRNPNETGHRRSINSLWVEPRSLDESYLFTGSGDRLIKLWHVNYNSQKASLCADLDSHTDWVNQVILVPEARNTLISCSSDTTIKLWRLDELRRVKERKRILPVSSLADHEDSVRFIDYSRQLGRLFSAADDGSILMWDLNCEKLLQKYEIMERDNTPYLEQLTAPLELQQSKACPTAMASGPSGHILFVAFSDNSLRMIDTRVPDKNNTYSMVEFVGGHEDCLVKSLHVSQDESVVYSGGTDGVVCIWDVGQQQIVQKFGGKQEESCEFHSDSIWHIRENPENSFEIMTAGKDGKVFMTDVASGKHQKLYEAKNPIISLALDVDNKHVWLGTTRESSVQSFAMPQLSLEGDQAKIIPIQKDQQASITIPGLPHIVDYAVLNNKRFVLTKDSETKVQLWQLDTCKCIHTFPGSFDDALKLLKETYDLHQGLPQSWMSVNIHLGSLQLNLEESNWNKATVQNDHTDIESRLHGKDCVDTSLVNLGSKLMGSLLSPYIEELQAMAEQDIKDQLKSNFKDWQALKKQKGADQTQEASSQPLEQPVFMSVQVSDNGKPKWHAYSNEKATDLIMMREILPVSFSNGLLSQNSQKTIKKSSQVGVIPNDDRLSIVLISHNKDVLAQFYVDDPVSKVREEKSFKIPKKFTVEQVLNYLYKDQGLSQHIIKHESNKDDACAHLEMLIRSNVVAPEDGQHQLILLDNSLTMQQMKDYLWDEVYEDCDPATQKLHLIYRKKV